MVRQEGWENRFSEYLTDKQGQAFSWGVNDCLSFVAGAVEAITSTNLKSNYPDYNTEEEAAKVLRDNGGLVKIIDKHLGAGNRNILCAKRGDVVIIKLPEITAAIVDDSGQFVVAPSAEKGYSRYPLLKAWKFWSY